MSLLLTVIILGAVFSLLILAHECGHFFTARRLGCRVDEFGIGFPPRLFSWRRGLTRYSINLVPVGGFVKLHGEDEPTNDGEGFAQKPRWIRAAVISGGIIMNLLLAVGLFTAESWLGTYEILEQRIPPSPRDEIVLVQVLPERPAAAAGLREGDVILAVAGEKIHAIETFQHLLGKHAGKEVVLRVRRGEEQLNVTVVPRLAPPQGEGPLGILIARQRFKRYGFWAGIMRGWRKAGEVTLFMLAALGDVLRNIIFRGALVTEVTGPVGIAVLTQRAAQLGLSHLLSFTAIISVNLALINALPLPALDGGRLLFLLVETIRGRPVPHRLERFVHGLGFALLLSLIIFITIVDVRRFTSLAQQLEKFWRSW
jgi:regulator of sigma E protease